MCTAYRAYLSRYRETSALYAFTSPCNTRSTSAASELSIPSGPCIDTCRHSRERVARWCCSTVERYVLDGPAAITTNSVIRLVLERVSARRIEPLLLPRMLHEHVRGGKTSRET